MKNILLVKSLPSFLSVAEILKNPANMVSVTLPKRHAFTSVERFASSATLLQPGQAVKLHDDVVRLYPFFHLGNGDCVLTNGTVYRISKLVQLISEDRDSER